MTGRRMKKLRLLLLIFIFIGTQAVFAGNKEQLKFHVYGIDGAVRTNAASRLVIERREFSSPITAKTVVRFAAESKKAVRAAVEPYGYFHPLIRTYISKESYGYKISYTIRLGLPVRVTSVDINITGPGADNGKIRKTARQFPLNRGDIFNATLYAAARDKLFDVISNQGYIKVTARGTKVFVNTDTNTAVITLQMQTNERYYFGKMTFNETDYSPKFLARFNIFREEQLFSTNKILNYQQDMNNTRYFKQVIVMPDFDNIADYHIPVDVSVVPVNARRYDFGLGYGTFTGPRLTAGMNFRRLGHEGHALDAQVRLSSVLSSVVLKYLIPGINPLTEQWVMGANYQKFVPKNGKSYSQSIAFGYTKKLHHWTLGANLNYLRESYRVENEPKQNSQLLYPNLNIIYIKADNVVQPTYGRSLNFVVQGAVSDIFSTTSFAQSTVKGKLFFTPVSFAHVILRGDLGYTVVHDLNDLPLSMRFFAGGMTTIRGFPDSSIGPGKYLAVGSIEYRNHIAYDISGAVFYDIGNAADHFDTPWNRGAGVGLVYESVVGPIKLYLARAISKKHQPYQVELSMGPEF